MHSERNPKALFTSQNILLNNVKWPTKAKKLNVNGEILSLQHPTVAFWKKQQKRFWVSSPTSPAKAWISQQIPPRERKFRCSKAFLCPVWGGRGPVVGGGGWRREMHCHWLWNPSSLFFHNQGISLWSWWLRLLSQSPDDFPTTSSTPFTKKPPLQGPRVTQPQETLTGAPQSVPRNQVVRPQGRKHPSSPGTMQKGRFHFRSALTSTDPGEERS